MFKKFIINIFTIAILLGSPVSIIAQSQISSPYSGFGIGIINTRSNVINSSMGGVSYAMQNPYFVNTLNPASYVVFDSLSFIADAAFSIISSNLRTSDVFQKGTNARLDYLTIGLPLTRYWRTSLGILPFSDLGYNIISSKEYVFPDTVMVNYNYIGEGGLMQLYWGNAFKLHKGLSIGLNISYLFGTLNTVKYVEFEEKNFLNSRIAQIRFLDGINLSAGLQYFLTLKEDHRLGFGFVYENSIFMLSRKNQLISYYTGDYVPSVVFDTLIAQGGKDAERSYTRIPQIIGGGISYSYKDRILIGADVSWNNWAKFSLDGIQDTLKNDLICALGIQFTPNPLSSKYLSRMNFRVGGRYSTGNLKINGTPINSYSLSVGLGFPIKTFTTRSSVNIMFEYGKMGTMTNDLILQNYMKFSFNFILQEKWYQRVKLE